jgi:hypothetical protein
MAGPQGDQRGKVTRTAGDGQPFTVVTSNGAGPRGPLGIALSRRRRVLSRVVMKVLTIMTRHAIALPASRWRTCLRGSVVGLAIWFGKPSSTAQVTVESYTDYASFVTRLGGGGSVTVIGFDDVSTSGDASFSIAADRYKLSDGIVITGEDGQFVSQTFEYASDYPAVSSPNTYAPGPENGSGNTTEATFFVGTTPALVPGFGVFFVDIDFGGPASLTVRDAESAQLATTGSLPNFGNGTQVFCPKSCRMPVPDRRRAKRKRAA